MIENEWIETGETKYCHHCGNEIGKGAVTCPKCGYAQHNTTVQSKRKDPGIAGILSFLITGVGQVYNGQVGKGIVLFFACIIGLILIIPGLIVWIYGIYDAYSTAKKINAGEMGI